MLTSPRLPPPSPSSILSTPQKRATAPATPASHASPSSSPTSPHLPPASTTALHCTPASHACQALLQPPAAARPSHRGCVLLSPALFAVLGLSLYQPVLLLSDGGSGLPLPGVQRLAYVCSAVTDTTCGGTRTVCAYPLVSVVVDASALSSSALPVPAIRALHQQRLSFPVTPPLPGPQSALSGPSSTGLVAVTLFPLHFPSPSSASPIRHSAAHHVELTISHRTPASSTLSHTPPGSSALSPQQWKDRLSLVLRNRYVCVGCRIALDDQPVQVTVSACLPANSKHVLLVTTSTTFTLHINAQAATPSTLSPTHNPALPSILAHPTPAVTSLLSAILLPLLHTSLFARLHVSAPRGVLLYGSPGVGKTYAVRAICQQLRIRCFVLESAELWGGGVGAGEERLREVWQTAQQSAAQQPTILFIDEIDVLCPQRSTSASAASSSSGDRLTGQLLSLMDGWKVELGLLVLAATNHPHTVDAALRRPGRFDVEVELPPPGIEERQRILHYYTRGMLLNEEVDLAQLAERCVGYVGADLEAVCREAGLSALKRYMQKTGGGWRHGAALQEGEKGRVTDADFDSALARIPASAQRSSLTYIPASPTSQRYTFAQLAGLTTLLPRLHQLLTYPLQHPLTFQRLGLRPARGVLLHGPPGCGKTSLVRAIAGQWGYVLLVLDVSAVYSQWVGEGERVVREAFELARRNAPSILFIDEIDAMVGSRDAAGQQSDVSVESRVLSTLLNEMDGIASANSTSPLLMAATNRLDALDAALTRPGRFDALLHVPLPDDAARADILRLHVARMAVGAGVDVEVLVGQTAGWSGADLGNLCREAGMLALRECREAMQVEWRHFLRALDVVKPMEVRVSHSAATRASDSLSS